MFQTILIMTPSFRLRFWHCRRVCRDLCEFTAVLFWQSGTGTRLRLSWALLWHLCCRGTRVRAASNITDRPAAAHGSAKTYYAIPLCLTYGTACWEDETSHLYSLCYGPSLSLFLFIIHFSFFLPLLPSTHPRIKFQSLVFCLFVRFVDMNCTAGSRKNDEWTLTSQSLWNQEILHFSSCKERSQCFVQHGAAQPSICMLRAIANLKAIEQQWFVKWHESAVVSNLIIDLLEMDFFSSNSRCCLVYFCPCVFIFALTTKYNVKLSLSSLPLSLLCVIQSQEHHVSECLWWEEHTWQWSGNQSWFCLFCHVWWSRLIRCFKVIQCPCESLYASYW